MRIPALFIGIGCVAALIIWTARGDRPGRSGGEPPERNGTEVRDSLAIEQDCGWSWTPNETTATGNWRRDSIRIGPLTILYGKKLASNQSTGERPFKIAVLVHPDRKLTVEIDPESWRALGFVRATATGEILRGPLPRLTLAACPGVPKEAQARDFGPLVGYPMYVQLKTTACVPIMVRVDDRRYRRTVSFGAGRCAGQ
jgi:hypothetical protein